MLDGLLFGSLLLIVLSAPFSIAISQNALGLAYILALLRLLRGAPLARTGLEIPALLLLLWALICIPFSQDPAQSLRHANRFLLIPALWFFATAASSEARRRALVVALALGGAGVALHGVRQFLTGPGGLAGRANLTQGYMTAGGLMMLVGLCLLAFLLLARGRRRRLLLVLALLPVLAALAFTQTRSAWLGFVVGSILVLALARPRLLPVFVLLGALVLVLAPGNFRERLRSSFDPGHEHNAQRLVMWQTGWRIMLEHPWTGVGDTDLKALYASYHEGEDVQIHGHLHSNYAMFGAIWGLPGLLLALGWLVALFVKMLRGWLRWRRLGPRAPPEAGAWILAALAAWSGFMIAGAFEWNFGDAEIALLLWSLVGLAASGETETLAGRELAT